MANKGGTGKTFPEKKGGEVVWRSEGERATVSGRKEHGDT